MSIFTLDPNIINDNEQSVAVLKQIFGSPIDAIVNSGSGGGVSQSATLITNFLSHFDTALSTVFFLIFAIILVVGTLNTAHEGKFLGKQWSSIWVPVRAIFGPVLIFPIAKGFCALQYILMYLILVGVQIATVVWQDSLVDINVGYVPTVPASLNQAVNDQLALAFMYGSVDYILSGEANGNYAGNVSPNYSNGGQLNNMPLASFLSQYLQGFKTWLANQGDQTPLPASNSANGIFLHLTDSQLVNWPAASGQDGWTDNFLNVVQTPYGLVDNLCWNLQQSTDAIQYVNNAWQASSNPFAADIDGSYSQYFSESGATRGSLISKFNPWQQNAPGYPTSSGYPNCVNGLVTAQMSGKVNGNNSFNFDDGTSTYAMVFGGNFTPGTGYINSTADGNFDANYSGTIAYNLEVNNTMQPLAGAPSIVSTAGNYPLSAGGLEQYLNGSTFLSNYVGGPNGPAGAAQYGAACGNGTACSFANYADAIIAALIPANAGGGSGNPPNCDPSQGTPSPTCLSQMVVPGTGCSCTSYCASSINSDGTITVAQNDSVKDVSVTTPTFVDTTDPNSCTIPSGDAICVGANGQTDDNATPTMACSQSSSNGNSQYITPMYYSTSWWYAGQVYLSLAQQMSNNIDSLAKEVSALAITTSGPPQVTFSGGGITYYTHAQVIAYTDNSNSKYSVISDLGTGSDIYLNVGNSTPGSNGVILDNNWPDVVNYIFFGSTPGYAQVLADAGQPTQADAQLINGAVKALQAASTLRDSNNNPTSYDYSYYQALMGLPAQFHAPIEALVAIDQKIGSGIVPGQANLDGSDNPNATNPYTAAPSSSQYDLVPYVENIAAVLMWNNVINNPFDPTSDSNTTYGTNSNISNPVQSIMSNIFNGLLGGGIIGLFGGGGSVTTNTTNIMNEIYNLGDQVITTDPSQLANQQFDMITDAQNFGVQMISTVVQSIETVSNQYKQASYAEMGVIGGVAVAGTAASLAGAGVPFTTLGSTMIGATQLVVQLMTMGATLDFTLHMVWLPAFIMVMTCLFTAGVGFALLLPLTPFILFWAGQMAWILGVIEAMIAAPLILLGMAHPGGHEVIGHAAPAVKMLLGIVFRPVLMVLGLLVGVVLTFIVISLSSQAFHIVGMAILGTNNDAGSQLVMDPTTQGILACILVMVYASFIMMAFTKCFSAIYVFPEKVVQWIGGHGDKAGAEELQQMTQSVNQTSDKAAQAGGQTLQAKADASKQTAQTGGQAAGQGMQTTGQIEGEQKRTNEAKLNRPSGPKDAY